MARSPTIIWCPSCEDWRPCKSIDPATFGEHERGNRFETGSGIKFFKRLRQCEGCVEDFATVEIAEDTFLDLNHAVTTLKAVKKAIRGR